MTRTPTEDTKTPLFADVALKGLAFKFSTQEINTLGDFQAIIKGRKDYNATGLLNRLLQQDGITVETPLTELSNKDLDHIIERLSLHLNKDFNKTSKITYAATVLTGVPCIMAGVGYLSNLSNDPVTATSCAVTSLLALASRAVYLRQESAAKTALDQNERIRENLTTTTPCIEPSFLNDIK